MNILFILYGNFSTNTANPIILFARELHALGHECVIAIPDEEGLELPADPIFFSPYFYNEVIKRNGRIFSNNQRADILHACTPRIGVIRFVQQYQVRWPTPLLIYLEDNELTISLSYLKTNSRELLELSDKELNESLPPELSNPAEFRYFISLADYILVIQEKLNRDIPIYMPWSALPWGVDLNFFRPKNSQKDIKKKLNIPEGSMVIVYHGGLNGFNRHALYDLCASVALINKRGINCFLVRTGPNPFNFLDDLDIETRKKIIELGVIDREEIPGVLSIADICIQPGRIDEYEDLRLPSKIPEFLAMGKPLICPNVNIACQFRDGIDAILLKQGTPTEIADEAIALFKNPKKMQLLGLNARRFAEQNFDIKRQSNKLIEAYKKCQINFSSKACADLWRLVGTNGLLVASFSKISNNLRYSIAALDVKNKSDILTLISEMDKMILHLKKQNQSFSSRINRLQLEASRCIEDVQNLKRNRKGKITKLLCRIFSS